MALSKSSLQEDLEKWFEDGSNNAFPNLAAGVDAFKNVVESWAADATDTNLNKVLDYSATPIVVSLSTLIPTDDTNLPALQLAVGSTNSWAGVNLFDILTPPDFMSSVSHIVTEVPSVTSTQQKFKDILDVDFEALVASVPEGIDVGVFIRKELASKWADALTDVAEGCTWRWLYVQNIPPVFPTKVISGNLF